MMASVTVKTDFSAAPRFRATVTNALRTGVGRAAVVLAGQMQRTIQKGGAARESVSLPGQPPVSQTGNMRRSITSGSYTGSLSAWAGANVPYAAILERGGTIKPKSAKYLPVPLSPAAARLQQVSAGGLRNSPTKLRFVKLKNGKMFLVAADRNRKGGTSKIARGDWLFVLKKSVTIRPRPWANPSVVKAGPQMVREFARTANREIMRGVLNYRGGVA